MIRLATSCTRCGSFARAAWEFTLCFDAEACRFAYRLPCPFCGDLIRRAVTDDTARVLLSVGVPHQLALDGPIIEAEIAEFLDGFDGDWSGAIDQPL